VRYRIVPLERGGGKPAIPVDRFTGVALFDWGADITRAFVVPEATVVAAEAAQLEAMFGTSWDASRSAMLMTPAGAAAGMAGSPVEPFARISKEGANHVVVEAGAGAPGGYLLLLDSYSPDWQATVDGQPATILRSNLLFRAVRLAPGRHVVEFAYRPRALLYGAALSVFGLVAAAVVAARLKRSGNA
jgi:hypothetical protein